MKIRNSFGIILSPHWGAWYGLERYYSILYSGYLLRTNSGCIAQDIEHIKRNK